MHVIPKIKHDIKVQKKIVLCGSLKKSFQRVIFTVPPVMKKKPSNAKSHSCTFSVYLHAALMVFNNVFFLLLSKC